MAEDAGVGDEGVAATEAVEVGAAEAHHFYLEEELAGLQDGLVGVGDGGLAGGGEGEGFHFAPLGEAVDTGGGFAFDGCAVVEG